MKRTDIPLIRLQYQQLAAAQLTTPKALVGWMGAMQAQDYAMCKWAVGLRLPGTTLATVNTALDKGQILRTHILRPTWHLVSAADLHWMLALAAPQLLPKMKLPNKELELTEPIYKKTNAIIEKALTGKKHLSREALSALFAKAKIATDQNRLSHIMMRAELDGLVCSGPEENKKQTYALLEERVKKSAGTVSREQALEKLAELYFTSRCPATLEDFTWWSGLSARDARTAMASVANRFCPEKVGEQTFLLPNDFTLPRGKKSTVHLCPAFDEFIIGYKDRTAVLPKEHHKKAISNNGLFWPVVLVNGMAQGLWKRTIQGGKLIITPELFQPLSKESKAEMTQAAKEYGKFLGLPPEVQY
jgi:hypothetical protein